MPIISPITDNLLFLKGEKHSTKVCAGDMRVDLETDCIQRPSYHARFSSLYDMKIKNKNIKMSSFRSSENIQKKEGGPDRSVSDNQSSSRTLNELAMKARNIL